MFLRSAIKRHGAPFDVTQYVSNAETIADMEGADSISGDPNVKGYTEVDEMIKELLA